jgi:replication factor C subunit 2/4
MSKDKHIPFVEKYRPKKIDDIILQSSMHLKILNIIKSKTLPNIIITGSPGTGKTSTLLCIAKTILGANYRDSILELNASNNRTLDFINTTIASFCKKKIENNTYSQKLIIFDEADNITKKSTKFISKFNR